jgi:hypothetical protein
MDSMDVEEIQATWILARRAWDLAPAAAASPAGSW